MANRKPSARVAILLATKNGERFLGEQLESLVAQSRSEWFLEASDDRSSDATVEILERFRARFPGKVRIRPGPCRGFAANFLSLALDASIEADYYAYCDQDDVWEPNKLARAIEWLRERGAKTPALYCGRTRVIDASGKEIGYSPLFRFPPSFRNALVQNIAGGNTMVFNRAAREKLLAAGMPDADYHDWWTYQVVSGCGGVVRYDPVPTVRYRQHGGNLVGPPKRSHDVPNRYRRLMAGQFRGANERNLNSLSRLNGSMSDRNQLVLRHFAEGRAAGPIVRPVKILRSGVYRQTVLGNCGLAAAALLGKI